MKTLKWLITGHKPKNPMKNQQSSIKNHKSLFPTITREEKWDRINAAWDLSRAFPVPKFQLTCPVCKGEEILYKGAKYHRRGSVSPRDPYRCDAKFKCCTCSNVWTHGVVVPKEMIDRHGFSINRNYHYTQVRDALENDQ